MTDEADAVLFIQFARFPEPGRVKTRLLCELSPAQACAVHEELLLKTSRDLLAARLGACQLWLDRCDAHSGIDAAIALGMRGPFPQEGGDLGERMYTAMERGLQRCDRVVLVGSDCPVLDRAYLEAAGEALQSHDVVFGPALDGGFVLVGARRVHAQMFAGVTWGAQRALAQSLTACREAGLSCARLTERYDIDTPDDLARWRREQRAQARAATPP